jgi:phage terminase large subunit-like protein
MLQTSCGLAAAARHHNARGDTLAEDADPGRRLTRISARANAANLAPAFIDTLDARCGGSRLGRQELEGELTEDR